MGENWENVLDNYWINILGTTQESLRFVENAFQCSAMSFDENFKQYFLRATNDWVTKAYDLYLTKTKLKEQFIGVRGRNDPTNHYLNTNKTTTDASGETVIKGSCSCHRSELCTAQSTYKITQSNGRGDGSAIYMTIIISNQQAIDPKTNEEVCVLVNRTESDRAMDETESMPTTNNGIDVSEDNTGNDASNKGTTNESMTTDEASPATGELNEINEMDTQENEPIHIDLPNDMIVDERIDLIPENIVEPSENIENEINENEAQEVTTNQPATEPISAVAHEEINEATDRPEVKNAMDESQLLPSVMTESELSEENIGNGTTSDGTTNGMTGTNEANRDINELDEINEFDAPEIEAIEAIEELSSQEINEVIDHPDENNVVYETVSMRTTTNGTDVSEDITGIDELDKETTNNSVTTDEASLAIDELNEINEMDAQEDEPIHVDLPNDTTVDERIDLIPENTVEPSENIDSVIIENEAQEVTTNQPATETITTVAHEEINEVTDRPDVNNAMGEPQLLPSITTEIDLSEENIGNGTISDETTNGIIGTNEIDRAVSELDEINEINAPEIEAILIDIESDSIIVDLTHEIDAASLDNIGNQINQNDAQKKTTNQRQKRKIADASTSNGNSKKIRRIATRSTLKTIPESISEPPLIDLKFDDAERSHQSNNVDFKPVERSETNSNGAERQNGSTSKWKSKKNCEFCNYVAKRPAELIRHRRIHTGEKPFKCNICAKGFTQKAHLNVHIRTHAKLFPFHCLICRQGFNVKRTKDTHEKKCNLRRYECYLCKYDTLYKTHLVRHMCIHTVSRPFRCSHFAKRFAKKSDLESHLKRLNGKAKLQVEELFTAEECLENETNSNGTEQPNGSTSNVKSKTQSEFCNYEAKNPENLIVHRRTHTDENPFECIICAEGFTRKENLKTHMKTHGKQFPFHCSICRQEFMMTREKLHSTTI
ncbi:zinc finger protein 37-like [Contarinia nasturtii]|uniref:zinc finger protein 37-like n=1 Tax=Contarinia nasturtii TaxID=265458 RepID=UPI0012D479E7|nr:zinc finger protein 37-like [Contarinia nasturtii]